MKLKLKLNTENGKKPYLQQPKKIVKVNNGDMRIMVAIEIIIAQNNKC